MIPETCTPTLPTISSEVWAGVLARYCPWHGGWISQRDKQLAEAGAAVTDGMCGSCEARAYRSAGIGGTDG